MNEYKHVIQDNQEYVLLPVREFNGLQKTLRIINDRAVQQIDKSVADIHGYQFLRANKREIKETKGKYWYTTWRTPYSLKMTPEEALVIITHDLKTYYGYIEDSNNCLYFYQQLQEGRTINIRNENQRRIYEQLMEKQNFSFGFDMLSYNFAQGVYEISYYMQSIEYQE